jgi:hypothetical protein
MKRAHFALAALIVTLVLSIPGNAQQNPFAGVVTQ